MDGRTSRRTVSISVIRLLCHNPSMDRFTIHLVRCQRPARTTLPHEWKSRGLLGFHRMLPKGHSIRAGLL